MCMYVEKLYLEQVQGGGHSPDFNQQSCVAKAAYTFLVLSLAVKTNNDWPCKKQNDLSVPERRDCHCMFIDGLLIIMHPFQVILGGRAVSQRLGDFLLLRVSRQQYKPVPGDIQDVQFCRLRELRRYLHQPVLPHAENVQTAAAANLQHGEGNRIRLDVTHSSRQVKKNKMEKEKKKDCAHLGFSSVRTKGPQWMSSFWALCPRIGDGRRVKCQCVVTART